jgi:hypothetical protein
MKTIVLGGLFVCSLFVVGCGAFTEKDSSQRDDAGLDVRSRSACVQGVVVNGLTGERIPLAKTNESGDLQGVSVLVHNQLLQANAMIENTQGANTKLVGEYALCGFPLDETFPIFAWVDGFESFEGLVKVESTLAQRTPNSREVDIQRVAPTLLANIKLYPKGTETRDLKFIVSHGGLRVSGAQIQLRTTGGNVLDASGTLTPQIRIVPQTLVTNSSGEVAFPAADLVLGGIYEYTILPPEGGDQLTLNSGNVTVGLRTSGASLTHLPYEIKVDLGSSRAVQSNNPIPSGNGSTED